MNKQEAIEKIKNIDTLNINDIIAGQQVDMVIKNQVLDIISQIDEPQKPVVPKFVAEWLEEARAEEYSLYGAWEMVKEGSEIFWWLFDGHESNQDTFNRAWLDGYESEKEKLYTVRMPNPNRTSVTYTLYRKDDGKIIIIGAGDDYEKREEYQLTEAEIKEDFEWAWQFAKEVENDTEN